MLFRQQVDKVREAAALAVLNRYPKIAYIHVPKCAGLAVRESLFDAVYPAAMRVTRGYYRIDMRASQSATDLLGLSPMTYRQGVLIHALTDPFARFITGHVFAAPRVVEQFPDWKFVTILRDPMARFISAYVFFRYKSPDNVGTGLHKVDCDFVEYLDSDAARRAGSIITRYFSGMSVSQVQDHPEAAIAAALANLERFFSVGFVGNLDDWALNIGRALRRKVRLRRFNSSPKPQLLDELDRSPELRKRVQDLCAVDRQLYAGAQTRFTDKINRITLGKAMAESPLVPLQLRSQ
jgi:hypothetical protein